MNAKDGKSDRSADDPQGQPARPARPGWTNKEIRLLGKQPDHEIARRTGRTVLAVQMKRLSLGIASCRTLSLPGHGPVQPEKVRLLFGPYKPPRTGRGQFLFCELRGTVKVGGYSHGLIS